MRPWDDCHSSGPDWSDADQAELNEALSGIGFNITTEEVAERLGISLDAARALVKNALEGIHEER
jgi:DNA-binding CsgD family transcriptional regulator